MTNRDYELLNSQLRTLLEDEPDALASTSNFVALLFNAMPDFNWLGVLDIDSPSFPRFSESDRRAVEELCATFRQLQRIRGRFI